MSLFLILPAIDEYLFVAGIAGSDIGLALNFFGADRLIFGGAITQGDASS